MVQKHRSAHKATFAKDVSPMRNMSVNKHALSSSPARGMGLSAFGARLNVPTATTSRVVETDKWKYNNMVNQQREQFNGLHYC